MTPLDWHPTEEDLTLDAYGDNGAAERAAIARHLIECTGCRTSALEIKAMQALAHAADVPEPAPDFEDLMWARIAPALATMPRWSSRQWVPLAAWAAAAAALVVLTWHGRPNPPAAPSLSVAVSSPSDIQERVLLTALDTHLARTELLFIELMNAPDHDTAWVGFERATADDLVQSGRLYRETAREVGDRRMEDVLDDLQPVLMEVAQAPDQPNASAIDAIRSRITDNDLLFKVRAVTNEIRDRQQTPATNEGAS